MKQLAKITHATLEIQRSGILHLWISVDYEDGMSQNIGYYALDTYDEDKKRRIGTAYGCEMIRRLLIELDVNDFSEMVGKIIWVHGKGEGFCFIPTGIQSLRVNGRRTEGVIFSDVAEEFGV